MKNYRQLLIAKLHKMAQSPKQLTSSCAVGVFIACSPFLGIQTVLALGISYVLGLNTSIVLLVLCAINNPLTMVPIMAIDYCIGHVVFERILQMDMHSYSPTWLSWVDAKVGYALSYIVPMESFALGNYLLGGLLFAFVCSALVYVVLYYIFHRVLQQKQSQ